ncbi:transcriptional regulator, TetR family [Pseudonocardia thermophila]|uniref:Transcriptional regulator, TetR family n=1 Tax=Pseudonocardia thermophila TaxID=1848 RepID=A0A1M6WRN3_PSETH|nr:TetR/AcrR family transcriptional regulator [Pseudonocardia thermophila]SHK96185.1 transcriptional regulator, TetR family [Pseudonocardia thermophila]
MSESSGRSIRSGERGREVLDAAAAVFARKGYAQTSLDDIADELGATKGLIYHHYRSKESLLLDVLTTGAKTLIDGVRQIARSDGDPRARLRAMAREHVRITMTDVAYQRTAFRSLPMHVYLARRSVDERWGKLHELRAEHEGMFRDVIEQVLKEDGRTLDSVDTRTLARGMLGALNWVNVWYREERDQDVDGIADTLAEFVVNGVSPRP